MSPRIALPVALFAIGVSVGCQKKTEKELAPVASVAASAKPASSHAVRAKLDPAHSSIELVMKAPLENIYGTVKSATSGELFVDLSNLEKTTGLVEVNLQKLVLTHEKRETEDGEFGGRQIQDRQNQHARTWLEISDDTPEADRKKNEIVTFNITKVADVSARDVTKLGGSEREATATVTGDFVLHQRKVQKSAKMKIVFEFDGDRATGIHMTTVEPFVVDLEEHDVRPRKAFGVLADATLATLGQKVDKHPKVSLDLRAKLLSDR